MKFDRFTGLRAPEVGWHPPLRYLLRRARVMPALGLAPGSRVLEIGCGAGALLHELSLAGIHATALESSGVAREAATALRDASGASTRILAAPDESFRHAFDCILALDVLEHIEDDEAALRAWLGWLAPGGAVIVTVPAHQAKWGPGDVWAGHFRRYERNGLRALFERVGLRVERFECYGFPVANLGEIMAAPYYRKQTIRSQGGESDRQANNDRSGVDRRAVGRLSGWLTESVLGRTVLSAAVIAQRPFLGTDVGSGYLLRARRT